MSKSRLKQLLWLILMLFAAGTGLVTVAGLANLAAYFQQGADPAAALNIVPNRPPDWPVQVAWRPDPPETGRVMDPLTRAEIEAAYVRAWLQLTLSYERGEPHGLGTYFSGPALKQAEAALASLGTPGFTTKQVALSHDLELHFYAADGSLVSMTDHRAGLVYHVLDSGGSTVLLAEKPAAYEIIMVQTDGLWKIRHRVRRSPSLVEPHPGPLPSPSRALLVTASGGRLELAGNPYAVQAVGYYPQDTPWLDFWPAYDGAQVAADLALAHELGFNTVRIFIPYEQFGADQVDPVMMARLRDFLNVAYRQDLRVIVTLFDFYEGYSLLEWPHTDRHLKTLLTTFAGHPAILAWDLKNEPDREYNERDPAVVLAWLSHTADLARRTDPYHLITIGWSDARHAAHLANQVDFVTFRYSGEPSGLAGTVTDLQAVVGKGKPLVPVQIGVTTWNSLFFPGGQTEGDQEAYLARILDALSGGKTAGIEVHSLYDYATVPAHAAGRWPWQTGPQAHMGLLDQDGRPKPAAALFRPGADLANASDPSPLAFNFKPFWLTAALLVSFLLALTRAVLRR